VGFLTVRPVILDLFCGAGGASMGYHYAGFDVVGVDIEPQPNYPFEFVQADAMEFDLRGFDAIHASPPCQAYSDLALRNGADREYPRLIAPIRGRLINAGVPYIIENVEGAPLLNPVMLCGVMFEGLRVVRHRLFETSFAVIEPPHEAHPLVFTHDKRKKHYGQLDQSTSFIQVTGGGNSTAENARDAMGINWMTKAELNQAIPPCFTQYLGYFARKAIRNVTA
jgi:DNA (cytosine-5)-methyltransferase 1